LRAQVCQATGQPGVDRVVLDPPRLLVDRSVLGLVVRWSGADAGGL
jgi:hypothetical protein